MSWRIAVVVCAFATTALQVAGQDEELWNDIGISLDSTGRFTEDGHESAERLSLAKLLSALKQDPMRDTLEIDERGSSMNSWDQLSDRREAVFGESDDLESPQNLASRYDPLGESVETVPDDTRLSTDPSLFVEQDVGNIAQVMGEESAAQADESTAKSSSDESVVEQNVGSAMPKDGDSSLKSIALNLIDVNPSAFSPENTESVITDSRPRPRSRSPTKHHRLDLHSHAHTHLNSSSSLAETGVSSFQKQDKKEDLGSSSAKASASSGPIGWLLKAVYYNGVLAMSAPWRPFGMMLLASIVAFPCFLLGYWMKPASKDRNRYIHKGRVVYEWKETSERVVLYTKLPSGLTAKGLDIKMWPHHLKMGRVGKQPFIREELFGAIVVEKSFWEVSNDELVVTLLKESDTTWPCVFRSHHPGQPAHSATLL